MKLYDKVFDVIAVMLGAVIISLGIIGIAELMGKSSVIPEASAEPVLYLEDSTDEPDMVEPELPMLIFEEDVEKELHPLVNMSYDYGKLVRVITAEAGSDYHLCLAICQCVMNACVKENWRYTPEEILDVYGYTSPVNFTTPQAEMACENIFLSGGTCEFIGDALYFYNSNMCEGRWHNTMKPVINMGPIRFFTDWT